MSDKMNLIDEFARRPEEKKSYIYLWYELDFLSGFYIMYWMPWGQTPQMENTVVQMSYVFSFIFKCLFSFSFLQ